MSTAPLSGTDAQLYGRNTASALSGHDSSSALKHKRTPLAQRRFQSLLINPDAHPDLPTVKAATAANLNLEDIQGDLLIGMKKNRQLFYFFGIVDAPDFKAKLAADILPLITTTNQLLSVSTQPITALNIAFSQTGLTALNVTDSLGDSFFSKGQLADAKNLGDPGTTNWVPEFTATGIHGVLLFASDTDDNINNAVAGLEAAMGDSITKVYSLSAAARPAPNTGHEHFGFLDGISNPAVIGFGTPMPGQFNISAGSILVGETGDGSQGSRPAWAKGGSFLVFRQLKQLVPEFNKFLIDNPIVMDGLTPQQGSDLLGARMGAPVDLAPLFDDPELGADPKRNNNFTFQHSDAIDSTDQTRCPFSAHIRKTRPRADIPGPEESTHHIMRAGIPYGPEVSDDEAFLNTTSTERGLAFVSYQSSIGNGFRFLQQTWADNANGVGVDPIIGALADLSLLTLDLDFVVSRGGEYFFSPSLSAIASKLSV
ncbi:fungal peroxidase [Mycena galopus ATCC 62051]|nr:fungal peroxidase [Mycena galopus ATCC 62051]KAF8164451.1 fungal peroxidase [Mycena galopus ATCC 62051]